MWTKFMDMHSGGDQKEDKQYILIEAPEEEAKVIFYNRFGHNPERITCTCCGEDYSISEYKTLDQATGFERGCAFENDVYVERGDTIWHLHKYQTLDEYKQSGNAMFIYASEIKDEERKGDVPKQGSVWVG